MHPQCMVTFLGQLFRVLLVLWHLIQLSTKAHLIMQSIVWYLSVTLYLLFPNLLPWFSLLANLHLSLSLSLYFRLCPFSGLSPHSAKSAPYKKSFHKAPGQMKKDDPCGLRSSLHMINRSWKIHIFKKMLLTNQKLECKRGLLTG